MAQLNASSTRQVANDRGSQDYELRFSILQGFGFGLNTLHFHIGGALTLDSLSILDGRFLLE